MAAERPTLDLDALLTISTAVNSSLELREICATACRIACEQLRVGHSSFVLCEPGMKEGSVFVEYPTDLTSVGPRIPLDVSSVEKDIIRPKHPLEIPDVRQLRPSVFKDYLLKLGVSSVLIVPVIRNGSWLGSFSLGSMGAPREFSESDKNFCRLFAAQIAVAIHNSRQYQASESSARGLYALRKSILPILTELDRESLLQGIVKQAVDLLRARSGGIYEFRRDTQELTIISTHGSDHLLGKTVKTGEGFSGRAVEAQRPHMIENDYQNREGKAPAFSGMSTFECVLEVPLMRDTGNTLGVLYVEAPCDRPFTESDAELLKVFSEPAAIALTYSEVREQRDTLARIEKHRAAMLQRLNDLNFRDELSEDVHFRVQIVERALALVGWTAGAMYLYSSSDRELRAVVNLGLEVTPARLVVLEGQGLVGNAAKSRSCRLITRASDKAWFEEEFGDSALQTAIALPLSTYHDLDSIVLLVCDQRDDSLLALQRDILIRFASQVSSALQIRTLMDPGRAELDAWMIHLMGGDVRTEQELDTLLIDMLTLITAQFGLKCNRALLFVLSDDGDSLLGRKAIGHIDQASWEADCSRDESEGLFAFGEWRRKREVGLTPLTPLGEWIPGVAIPVKRNSQDAFSNAIFGGQDVVVIPPQRAGELPPVVREKLDPTTDTALVPLTARGKPVGILAVDNKFTRSQLTRRELTSLQIYGRVVTLAINQYELVRRTKATTDKLLEIVASIGAYSSDGMSPTEVLKGIGRATAEGFEARTVVVIANDELARRRRFVYDRVSGHEQFGEAPALDTNSAKVWSEGAPLLLESANLVGFPMGPALGLPISFEGGRLGVIWVHYDDPLKVPRLDPTALLFYAGHAGMVYANSKRLYELRRLQEATQALSGALELRDLEASILTHVMGMFEADSATLWPYDAKNKMFIPSEMVTQGLSCEPHAPGPNGISERLLREPFYIHSPGFPGECSQDFLRRNALRSFQGIALMAGGEAQGVLYVAYKGLRDFGGAEKRWLMDFGNYAALSLRMARAMAQLRRVLQAAEDVSSVIVSGNVQSTLKSVAQTTLESVRCNTVTLFRYDESSDTVGFPPTRAGDFRFPDRIAWMDGPDARLLVSRLIKRGKPTIAQSDEEMREFLETRFGREEEIQAVVAIPLRFGDRSVGLLLISFRSRQVFSAQDIRGIQLFADQAAVAMGQAQRFEALTTLSGELLAVSKQDAMERAIALAVDQLRVEFCVIVFREKQGYRVLAQRGWPADLFREEIEGDSHAGFTVTRRRPIIVNDFSWTQDDAELRGFQPPERDFRAGIVSGMSVPVIQDGEVVCVMLVHTVVRRRFTQQDIDFLTLIANQVVIAQRSAQRYQEIERQNRSLAAFYEAAKVIIERPEFELTAVLSAILTQSIKQMVGHAGAPKADLATIQLYDEADHTLVLMCVEPADANRDLAARIGDRRPSGVVKPSNERVGITGLVLRQLRTIRVSDIQDAAAAFRDQYVEFRASARSELAVPMLDRGVPIGVISLESDAVDAFDEHDEMIVGILAELAVIAIKQGRIRKEKEVAEASFVTKLGTTVHEIRGRQTPLRNETYNLLQNSYGELTAAQRLAVLRIQNAAEEQIRRTENIGYVVQIHEGELEPTFRKADLRSLMAEAVAVFQFQAERESVALHMEEIPFALEISLDKALIECVLRNLIENALRFTRSGGSVTVRAKDKLPDVVIEVQDTGVGIPADKLEKIFALFYKVPEHRSVQARGLGIGLSLCKRFVELHHGRLTVDSVEGVGSTFCLILPFNPLETAKGS